MSTTFQRTSGAILLALLGVGSAGAVAAQTAAGDAARPASGQLADGARIAANGGEGFAACASCHGLQGEGQAAAGFPRLAGQPAQYLANQLEAYANGTRVNAVMQPIAKALNPAARAAVAAHYAKQPTAPGAPDGTGSTAGPGSSGNATPDSGSGRTLAMVGGESRRLQACANCHGPDGAGQWPHIPALAGQHASYLKAALDEWKDGSRKNDPSGQMPRIAQALSDADVDAVSSYYAALPIPTLPLARSDPGWTTGRSVVSGPVAAAAGGKPAAAQGVGVDQGAALTGGSQGVGSPPTESPRSR